MNDISPLFFFLGIIIAFIIGVISGFLTFKYLQKKQIVSVQEQLEETNKKQVKDMLTAMGRKPSEEQVNRIINLGKNMEATRTKRKKKVAKKKK